MPSAPMAPHLPAADIRASDRSVVDHGRRVRPRKTESRNSPTATPRNANPVISGFPPPVIGRSVLRWASGTFIRLLHKEHSRNGRADSVAADRRLRATNGPPIWNHARRSAKSAHQASRAEEDCACSTRAFRNARFLQFVGENCCRFPVVRNGCAPIPFRRP